MADVETITDAARALEVCGDLFGSDPIGCNMVASVLRPGVATHLGWIREGDRTLGAIVDWPPGWTITRLLVGAHRTVAEWLPDASGRLWGAAPDVLTISQRWAERTGGSAELDELMRMYRLGDLPGADSGGELATIQPDDADALDRAAHWARAFGEDIGHDRDDHSATVTQMQRAAAEQRLYVWRHGSNTVAQLVVAPERFGVVRIGGVYTPPEHRHRGHASDLTAAMSAELRRQPGVREVTLLTQASNASTNRLYRRLGFTHVYDALSVDLIAR